MLEVLFDGDRAVGVKVADENGAEREVRAKVVVDASGQSSMLMNRFKLRVPDPKLNKGAVWTYCEGAYRDTGRDEGATLVLQAKDKKGWFWYIPLHNNIVSVGVVASFDYLFKNRGDHETIYNEELDRCPAVKERVAIGRRASRYFATKDYSYRASQAAGDGWVLVGDAFGFLDPLYSSGVLLALKSGSLAADAIAEGLAKGDTSGRPARQMGAGLRRRAWTACGGWSSSTTTASASAASSGNIRTSRASSPICLIGDLLKDELDEVIEPMNAIRRK